MTSGAARQDGYSRLFAGRKEDKPSLRRIDKNDYYLNIAQTVAERATCLRRRHGAIIVKNDEIIATGYNGAPRGAQNCCDLGSCRRADLNIPAGERYELCRAIHAEANAIISASRRDMQGATLYLVGVDAVTGEIYEDTEPCMMCKRMIINAGIQVVISRVSVEDYSQVSTSEWLILNKI